MPALGLGLLFLAGLASYAIYGATRSHKGMVVTLANYKTLKTGDMLGMPSIQGSTTVKVVEIRNGEPLANTGVGLDIPVLSLVTAANAANSTIVVM